MSEVNGRGRCHGKCRHFHFTPSNKLLNVLQAIIDPPFVPSVAGVTCGHIRPVVSPGSAKKMPRPRIILVIQADRNIQSIHSSTTPAPRRLSFRAPVCPSARPKLSDRVILCVRCQGDIYIYPRAAVMQSTCDSIVCSELSEASTVHDLTSCCP